MLNDCHIGACGGHLSGLATAQKILRAGYFWPTLIKDCIESVKKCHPCQIFSRKMRAHLALKKDAYRLVDFEGNALAEPRNGLYLKKYY